MKAALLALALLVACAQPLAPEAPRFVLGFDSTTTPPPNPNTPTCPPGEVVWWEYDYGDIGQLVRIVWFCAPPPSWQTVHAAS